MTFDEAMARVESQVDLVFAAAERKFSTDLLLADADPDIVDEALADARARHAQARSETLEGVRQFLRAYF